MSFLTIRVRVPCFTCCQEWGILNPLISLLELSCVIFRLKPSLRNVANCGVYQWSKFSPILSAREVFISSLISSNHLFPLVAEAHLIILRCFHKPATSLFLPLLFFKQLCSILLRKDALSNSFMVGDVGFILRSIHSNYLTIMHCFRRLCDIALFDPSSCFVKIM